MTFRSFFVAPEFQVKMMQQPQKKHEKCRLPFFHHSNCALIKTSLSAFDGKRYNLEGGKNTLPYGHKNLGGESEKGILEAMTTSLNVPTQLTKIILIIGCPSLKIMSNLCRGILQIYWMEHRNNLPTHRMMSRITQVRRMITPKIALRSVDRSNI